MLLSIENLVLPLKTIKIGNRMIGGKIPFFIAEAGINHNGNMKIAKKMVIKASEAGADAVKFQTFKTELLYPKNHKAFKVFKKYELSEENYGELKDVAKSNRIFFLSTPFDFESVDMLDRIGVPAFKIASSDLNFLPLIQYTASKHKPLIISTGMGNVLEIKTAIKTAKNYGAKGIAILHCVSGYPNPIAETNLNCIPQFKKIFHLPIGYSDNGKETETAIIATSLGADIIEKHFTLNSKQSGADHKMSIEPNEMKQLISIIKNMKSILGDGKKRLQPSERGVIKIARRGIYANRDLKKGTILTKKDFVFLRPPNGLKPVHSSVVGKKLIKTLKKGQSIVIN